MYVTAGEALALSVEFKVGGDYVVPDANSVKVSIRNQSGALVSGWNQKDIDHGALTHVAVNIDAPVNTASNREKRSVIVDFKINGGQQRRVIHYFVSPWLNTTVTCANVRNAFGASEAELPDEMISVEGAYYDLLKNYDQMDIDAALVDPDTMKSANDLILARAGLNVIVAMQLRVKTGETSDDESFTRSKIDWDNFYDFFNKLAADAIAVIFNQDSDATTYSVFQVVTPTDVITGA